MRTLLLFACILLLAATLLPRARAVDEDLKLAQTFNIDTRFASCSKTPKDTARIICNGTLVGEALIFGVVAVSCIEANTAPACAGGGGAPPPAIVYQIAVQLNVPVASMDPCSLALPWSAVPSSVDAPNNVLCGSLTRCSVADAQAQKCTPIFTQQVVFNVSQVTFKRTVSGQHKFPWDYLRVDKRKLPLAVVGNGYPLDPGSGGTCPDQIHGDQATLFLKNDDGDDNQAYKCLNATAYHSGIRTRGGGAKSLNSCVRNVPCTQDYNDCGCDRSGNGDRLITTNDDGCAINYCSSSSFAKDVSYLASTHSCWQLDQQTATGLTLGEYVPQVDVLDSSKSCCGVCGLSPVHCATDLRCNQPNSTNRYIFPSQTPLALARYYFNEGGGCANGCKLSMSNRLSTNSSIFNQLNGNTTRLFESAISGMIGQGDVDYLQTLFNGSDIPAVRRNGVYSTLHNELEPTPQITALVCASCGTAGNFWSTVCSAEWGTQTINSGYKKPKPGTKMPGIAATKSYILGFEPTCTLYQTLKAGQTEILASKYVNVRAQVLSGFPNTGQSTSLDLINAELGTGPQTSSIAPALGVFTTFINTVGIQGNVRDPLPIVGSGCTSDAAQSACFGTVLVVCEPYADAMYERTRSIGTLNPWRSLRNPRTQAPFCANCMPDELTQLAGSKQGRTQWYFLGRNIMGDYRVAKPAMQDACNLNGMSPEALFTVDDCDQTYLNIPDRQMPDNLFGDARTAKCKGLTSSSKLACPCGETKSVQVSSEENAYFKQQSGQLQSAVCMGSTATNDFCRPRTTAATAGRAMEEFRRNIQNPAMDRTAVRKAVEDVALPLGWNFERPNYWVAADISGGKNLALYYNAAQNAGDAKTQVSMSVLVPSTAVNAVGPEPTAFLFSISYCNCPSLNAPLTPLVGTMLVKLNPNTSGAYTTYPFALRLDWPNASCIFRSSLTNTLIVSPTLTTASCAEFVCTPNALYERTAGGTLTITSNPQEQGRAPTTVVQYLYSCTCMNKYSTNTQNAQSCGTNNADLCVFKNPPFDKARELQFQMDLFCPDNQTSGTVPGSTTTPEPAAPPPPDVQNPTNLPAPGQPSAAPVPNQPATPLPVPPLPTPTPSANASNTTVGNTTAPTPGEEELEDDSKTQLYIFLGVGGALLVGGLIVLVLVLVFCCNGDPDEETGDEEQDKRLRESARESKKTR